MCYTYKHRWTVALLAWDFCATCVLQMLRSFPTCYVPSIKLGINTYFAILFRYIIPRKMCRPHDKKSVFYGMKNTGLSLINGEHSPH